MFPRVPVPLLLALGLFSCSVASENPDNRGYLDLQGIEVIFSYDAFSDDLGNSQEGDSLSVEDGSADTPPSPSASLEYPTAELLVRITGPSATGYATSAGGVVALTGLVFAPLGVPVNLSWVAQSLEDGVVKGQGVAQGYPFWQTEGITLSPGDNLITITAQAGDETASDSIIVTFNPYFPFENPVVLRPPALFVGETSKVFATIAIGPTVTLADNFLSLELVDRQGKPIMGLGQMKDDGDTGVSGDEIQKDGVYTAQFNLSCSLPGPLYVRATATVKGAFGVLYVAKSRPSRIECVPRLSPTACASHQKTLAQAREAYRQAIASGAAPEAARQAAIEVLKGDPDVQEVASPGEEGGPWAQFKDGVLGAVNIAAPDTRGPSGSEEDGDLSLVQAPLVQEIPILSKKTVLLSPFYSEFSDDETTFAANIISHTQCPAYQMDGRTGAAANLKEFRGVADKGMVIIATHGDVYFKGLSSYAKQQYGWSHPGGQEVLWTGEAVNCGLLSTSTKVCKTDADCPVGTECLITQARTVESGTTVTVEASGVCFDYTQVDLMTGRVVLGDKTYGVTPAFFRHLGEGRRFPNSFFYLGACKSLYNGSLAAELYGAGALAIAGYSGVVTNGFATKTGKEFLAHLIEEKQTTGKAFGLGATDPQNPGSAFRLFGAKNLSVSQSEILNAGFETGDLTAWDQAGDGRVISRLGKTGPVAGKFMAIISTGLGFTTLTGEISQTFCIPPNVTTLSFWWRYYSEEFQEWCGSIYQDTFQAELIGPTGKKYSIVNMAVDDLCEPDCNNECDCYGGFWGSCPPGMGSKYVGLQKSDVEFDQPESETWVTPWVKATFNVSELAGKGPVTLRFFCTDQGDSIYDTAVLVDGIKFE